MASLATTDTNNNNNDDNNNSSNNNGNISMPLPGLTRQLTGVFDNSSKDANMILMMVLVAIHCL